MKFHYVKQFAADRHGRAKRGSGTSAKRYHLTQCGIDITPREADLSWADEDCRNCLRILTRD